MPDTDVLYADVKFKKTGGKATDVPSPSHDTTYSQVNIVKTQAPTEHSDSRIQAKKSANGTSENYLGSQQQTNGRSKVTPERVALVVLSVLLIATVFAFIFTYSNSMGNKGLSDRQQNTTDKPSPECDEGWEHYGDKCYHFSAFKSSWDSSRMFCREFRADLVKIDSEEEQRFLLNKLKDIMTEDEEKFWIGLTDSKTEGTWLWVDDSPLDHSLQFWWKDGTHNEPDDWKDGDLTGEDCVRMGEKGPVTDLNRWLDKNCGMDQRSICAKPAKVRQ